MRHEKTLARRQIVKLYLKQIEERGVANPKEIKSLLGYSHVNFIYQVIREYQIDIKSSTAHTNSI